jgi:hypothetical protein
LWASTQAPWGTGTAKVTATSARALAGLLSFIAEEGLGIIYLFDYYWRRARKHVAVIFYFRCCNYSALWNICGVKNCRGLRYAGSQTYEDS